MGTHYASAAHRAVQAAIARGDMAPEPCSVCGEPKAHAHHDDYSRPLDVIWLCPKHHKARHKALGWGEPGRPRVYQPTRQQWRPRYGKRSGPRQKPMTAAEITAMLQSRRKK